MARKSTSRIELRRQAEAAAARGEAVEEPVKKKASASTKSKKVKEKPVARKRLVWIVYGGNMKEEGRFSYDQRAAAEERVEQLRQKSNKKLYFIQPVKEVIGDPSATTFGLAAAAAAAKMLEIEDIPIPDELPIDLEAEFEDEEEEEEELEEEDEDE